MWGINVQLRQKARAVAKELGHDLLNFRSWGDSQGVQHSVTACLKCGAWVEIESPGSGTFGSGVKDQCPH